VVDFRSPGWSEAEPWVLNVYMRPALKERQRIARASRKCWDKPLISSVLGLLRYS